MQSTNDLTFWSAVIALVNTMPQILTACAALVAAVGAFKALQQGRLNAELSQKTAEVVNALGTQSEKIAASVDGNLTRVSEELSQANSLRVASEQKVIMLTDLIATLIKQNAAPANALVDRRNVAPETAPAPANPKTLEVTGIGGGAVTVKQEDGPQ